jgi:hypothetical protein
MKIMRKGGWASRALLLAILLAPAAGALARQDPPPPGAATTAQPGVTFVDQRVNPPAGNSRSSLFAPIITFGDKGLKPPVLPRFEDALRARAPAGASWSVTIDEFVLLDYFPVRSDHPGGIVGAWDQAEVAKHTDWAMVRRLNIPAGTDAIVLRFRGSINGRPVTAEVFAPYTLTGLGPLVRENKGFKDAVTKAIADAAAEAVRQAG